MKGNVKQFLSTVLETGGREGAVEESKLLFQEMTTMVSTRKFESWSASARSVSIQTCLAHIIQYIGNVYMGATFYKQYQHILLL